MRHIQIFGGTSHPSLVADICGRLGQNQASAELGKFSNGETKVQLKTSTRDQNVFIVQSGSNKINDAVMELLIMISACKSGSAKSVTAVIPYFPYSRQSKKKHHRGSITARMLANLLHVAGVNHVITIDLHASQMQGFFHCPVDNLVAEPLIAHWIKLNIQDWKKAVVVSKNPGGTKRVTSLADALKLNFGIVMTDRRRYGSGRNSMNASMVLDGHAVNGGVDGSPRQTQTAQEPSSPTESTNGTSASSSRNINAESSGDSTTTNETPEDAHDTYEVASDEDTSLPDAVVTGRLVHGHIVEDDAPSPVTATTSVNGHSSPTSDGDAPPDPMAVSSALSTISSRAGHEIGLGGSGDAVASSDDEEETLKNPQLESTVTLVGNVRHRPVFIMDDMIDKSTSWIAAAETVVKKGGATYVYCMATHGLFGDECLAEMEACECIHQIIVTNSFPIPYEKERLSTKLQILDVSKLLAESIRRNHHGESISQLYMHSD
ncbi:MAG: hypothetical protein M1828_001069 [Chrysothrix sp. TS-e1954]|nr:MAG: hypothetical protein M1828_001069 [Chrysothrix sp. TS-e1954]